MMHPDASHPKSKVSETSVFREMDGTFSKARLYRECALIVGPPGIGKTTGLQEMSRRDPSIILITATSANGAKTPFFRFLADHISERTIHFRRHDRQPLHDLFLRMGETLQEELPDFAIAADESQNIQPDATRLLLDLNEFFGVPILLVGNPHTLKSTKANQEALNQIWDRIEGHRHEFRGVGSGDVVAIAADHDVEGVDAYRYLEAFMLDRSLRRLASLLREARIYAGPQGSIRLPHLRKAVAVLHSEGEDRGLFKLIPKPRKEENAA